MLAPSVTTNRPRGARRSVRRPLSLAAVLVLGAALIALTNATTASRAQPSMPVTLVGLTPVGIEWVAYEAGASRTWPAGEQIVRVAVLAGRLTVYGPAGERHVYAAGEGYAAGWTAYRAVNETDNPVQTSVTRHAGP